MITRLVVFVFVTASVFANSQPPLVREEIDWPGFLGQHDMVWEQFPRQWNEGAFAGNGNMGFVAFATLRDNRIDFHLGRMDITDHRNAPKDKTSMGVRGAGVMYDFPRLDVGRLVLRPAGKIRDGTIRQHLWNAEITGEVQTDLGDVRFRALTLRNRMVSLIEVSSTEKSSDGKPAPLRWEFVPGNPSSPRHIIFPKNSEKISYVPNPAPKQETIDGVPVAVTSLVVGGDFATAWLEKTTGKGTDGIVYISTANEIPQSGVSARVAVDEVKKAAAEPLEKLVNEHRDAWQQEYRRSFVGLPGDPRLESFYWIQMHKLAACIRPDGPALDVLGPFYRTTQWPGLWWNLNVQLSYWPVYAGNRLDFGKTLTDLLDKRFEGIFSSFRNRENLGDFVWALHNYWWQYRFAGDWQSLCERWLPKAKSVFASYKTTKFETTPEGRINLKPMGSPEFHGFKAFPNTNYNLALLRWMLSAMIECDSKTSPTPSLEAAEWQKTLDSLAPYAVDENGLRIAENQALDQSPRHYSHLLPLYPLYQLDPDSPADRDLVVKSVKHWHQLEGGKALTGYSYTGGASLYASLGMGDEAVGMMRDFLLKPVGISQLHSNTFYTESRGRNPVIETPLSAASATMDLLLQSWGGKIRVFPAVPATWAEAVFHKLRAVGGFVVSAERKNGKTAWIAIRSEAGEPCVLKVRDWSGPLTVLGSRDSSVVEIAPGEYRLSLQKGEEVVVSPQGTEIQPVVRSSISPKASQNPYGVKKGGEIKIDQSWPEPPVTFAE